MVDTTTTTEKTYLCRCVECNKEFKSDTLIELSGVTMGGYGDSWDELVSPCCHADYDEV